MPGGHGSIEGREGSHVNQNTAYRGNSWRPEVHLAGGNTSPTEFRRGREHTPKDAIEQIHMYSGLNEESK